MAEVKKTVRTVNKTLIGLVRRIDDNLWLVENIKTGGLTWCDEKDIRWPEDKKGKK